MARTNSLDNGRNSSRSQDIREPQCRHDAIVYIDDVDALLGKKPVGSFTPKYTASAGCLVCGGIINASSTDYKPEGCFYRRIPEDEREPWCV